MQRPMVRDAGPPTLRRPTSQQRAREAAEAVARRSYAKLVAQLAAQTRDVAGAEDAVSEAFVAALVDWAPKGVPGNPEAWLSTVARRKWIDADRRRRHAEDARCHLRLVADEREAEGGGEAKLPDERLALMFACADPAIDPAIRAPLMLQTILGLDAARLGAAFRVLPAAMSQRLVRAKRKLREARIPFRVPRPDELAERLAPVLEALYVAFSESRSGPTGCEARGHDLTEEAIWLCRLLVWLLPGEPEARGLLAFMLHARPGARAPALGFRVVVDL